MFFANKNLTVPCKVGNGEGSRQLQLGIGALQPGENILIHQTWSLTKTLLHGLIWNTHTHTHFKGTRDGHLPAQWDAFCTKTTMLKYWHSESTEEPKAGERTHRPGRGYRNEMISWSANSRNNKLYVLIIDDTFFFLFLFSFSSASFNKAFWTLI